MHLIITIDTEADNQWLRPSPTTTENVRFLPRFQELCNRFDFKPTWLSTWLMVKNPVFVDFVSPHLEAGCAEVGAHIHPWTTPPIDEAVEGDGSFHAFPHELPLELFKAKMTSLTELITDTFEAPISYRAGRYGFNETHIDVLLELGYKVDCSVVPYTTISRSPGMPGGVGGMDFRTARPHVYFPDYKDCRKPGNSTLLEVPVTVLFPKWPLRSIPALQSVLAQNDLSLISRALNKYGYGPRWLRPSKRNSAADLIEVCRAAQKSGAPFLEMMFHSSELMPGCSPNFPDETSIERLYETFETLFTWLRKEGVQGATLGEFATNWLAGNKVA